MTSILPTAIAREVGDRREIAIRTGLAADEAAILHLARLTDRPVPEAPVLIAETDGALVAALSTSTGAVVSDPFRATADLIELLRLRASQLDRLAA